MTNKLKTISNEDIETTIFSDRGGIVTSIKIDGTELLYQDMYDETLFDFSKSVRGGIPYMFPNAGPLTIQEEQKSAYKLPQHGFGRIDKWEQQNTTEKGKYIQNYHLEYRNDFPFEADVENIIELKDNKFITTHRIKNIGDNIMPISTGFHPYFRVPKGNKQDIKWLFPGGEDITNQLDIWSNDGTISFQNPGVPIRIDIPGLGILQIEVSSDYKLFWLRSMPGKDFICVEPVMGEEGNIVNNPIYIKAKKENVSYMKISIENP